MMYEHYFIEIDDVHLVRAWLESLIQAGYQFPSLGMKTKITDIKTHGTNINLLPYGIAINNQTNLTQVPTLPAPLRSSQTQTLIPEKNNTEIP